VSMLRAQRAAAGREHAKGGAAKQKSGKEPQKPSPEHVPALLASHLTDFIGGGRVASPHALVMQMLGAGPGGVTTGAGPGGARTDGATTGTETGVQRAPDPTNDGGTTAPPPSGTGSTAGATTEAPPPEPDPSTLDAANKGKPGANTGTPAGDGSDGTTGSGGTGDKGSTNGAKANGTGPTGAQGDGAKAKGNAKSGAPQGTGPTPDAGSGGKDATGTTPAPAAAGAGKYGASSLVDEELAEHERWKAAGGADYIAALDRVGGAGSDDRTSFIVNKYASGYDVLGESFVTGLVIGGITGIAAAFAKDVVPFIGGLIGGVMTIHTLATRTDAEWQASKDRIKGFMTGSDEFEMMANSLDAISEILSYVSMALNLYNLYCTVVGGIVSICFPPAFPVVASVLTIIGVSILVIDAIRTTVLEPLSAAFRALHMFESEADPRLVEGEGDKLQKNAAEFAGFVGGFAGALLGHFAGETGAKGPGTEKSGTKPPSTGGQKGGGPDKPSTGGEEGPEGAKKGTPPDKPTGASGGDQKGAAGGAKVEPPRVEVELEDPTKQKSTTGPDDGSDNPPDTRRLPEGMVRIDDAYGFLCDTQAEALAKYEQLRQADPTKEVGLRERKPPDNNRTMKLYPGEPPMKQWAVVQGNERGVSTLNQNEWTSPQHSHPNPKGGATSQINHIASGQVGDMGVLRGEVERSAQQRKGPPAYREAVIDVQTRQGSDQAFYGYDPNRPDPVFIDTPNPEWTPSADADTPKRITLRFKSFDAYESFVKHCAKYGFIDVDAAPSFGGSVAGNEGPAATRTPFGPPKQPLPPPPGTSPPDLKPPPAPDRGGGSPAPDTTPMPSLKFGHNEIPVVPRYEEPPATPQQLAALEDQVRKAKTEQSKSAQVKNDATADAKKAGDQADQLKKAGQDAAADGQKIDQHKGNVDDAAAATKKQQDKVGQEKTAGQSYLAKKASINQLRSGVQTIQTWSDLASTMKYLPMDRAQQAAVRLEHMSKTAGKFLVSLDTVDKKLSDSPDTADKHEAKTDANAKKLADTKDQANDSKAKVDEGKAGVDKAGTTAKQQQANSTDVANKAGAQQQAAGASADAAQTKHDDLQGKLRTWAAGHRIERHRAASALVSRLKTVPGARVTKVVS
jgi:hypothetical protein